MVFRSKLVGVVDAVVTCVAQGGLVCSAEHGGLLFVTHVALNLHLFVDLLPQSDHFQYPEREYCEDMEVWNPRRVGKRGL